MGNDAGKGKAGAGIGLGIGVTICVAARGAGCFPAIPHFFGGGPALGAPATLDDYFDPPPPPGTSGQGGSRGEPHLETCDGVRYDSQLVGEFVVACTDDFEIRKRQSRCGNGGAVACNLAIAVGVAIIAPRTPSRPISHCESKGRSSRSNPVVR
ncbi:MAG: hypothetical protein BMS9Abin12_2203 [Acidimicrobiia bacterium]|nr:MAG: hypothetical protein BMS9Abin12_2203 [Acidimicrobiia bacterium]